MKPIKFFKQFIFLSIPDTNTHYFLFWIFYILFCHLTSRHQSSTSVNCETHNILLVFIAICLLLCLYVHFDTQACCWEKDMIEILGKSAHVTNLIFNVLIPNTKHMLNLKILFRRFIVPFGIVFRLKIRWLLDLTNVMRTCRFLFPCGFLNVVFFLSLLSYSFPLLQHFLKKLFIINLIRLIIPHNYRLFFSTDTYQALIFPIELHRCDRV